MFLIRTPTKVLTEMVRTTTSRLEDDDVAAMSTTGSTLDGDPLLLLGATTTIISRGDLGDSLLIYYGYDIRSLLHVGIRIRETLELLDRYITDHDDDWIHDRDAGRVYVVDNRSDDEENWDLGIQAPFTTALLAGVCVLVYHRQTIKGDAFTNAFHFHPGSALAKFQIYRFVTNVFFHSDASHLSGNMVSLLAYGSECEKLYGSLRLLEATIWAIILESVVMVFLAFYMKWTHRENWSCLGFSGILYFWLGMSLAETETGFRKLVMAAKMLQEVFEWKEVSSLIHLSGAVNGLLYSRIIMDRTKLPTTLLCQWDERLERLMKQAMEWLGLESSRLFHLIRTKEDVEEEEEEDSDSEYDGEY